MLLLLPGIASLRGISLGQLPAYLMEGAPAGLAQCPPPPRGGTSLLPSDAQTSANELKAEHLQSSAACLPRCQHADRRFTAKQAF